MSAQGQGTPPNGHHAAAPAAPNLPGALDGSRQLKLNLAGAAVHRADDDLHVVAELGHQFQQLGFADAAELTAGDA